MLTTNLIRKVSEIRDELEGVYQELRADKETSGQFHIGKGAGIFKIADVGDAKFRTKSSIRIFSMKNFVKEIIGTGIMALVVMTVMTAFVYTI